MEAKEEENKLDKKPYDRKKGDKENFKSKKNSKPTKEQKQKKLDRAQKLNKIKRKFAPKGEYQAYKKKK